MPRDGRVRLAAAALADLALVGFQRERAEVLHDRGAAPGYYSGPYEGSFATIVLDELRDEPRAAAFSKVVEDAMD